MKHGLILLILVFLTPLFSEADGIFRSNDLGMPLEKIPEARERDFAYVLVVTDEGEKSIRRLFHGGREFKRWEREEKGTDSSIETYLEEGLLTRTERFVSGLLTEEQVFSSGLLSERRVFSYEKGRLSMVTTYGTDGLRYTDTYIRSLKGDLHRFIRSYPDGKRIVSSFSLFDGKMLEEWHGDIDNSDLFRFSSGKLLSEETYIDGKLAVRKEYTYPAEHAFSVEEDFINGTKTERQYDASFRVVSEIVEDPATGRAETAYTYADSVLAEKTRRSPGLKEQWMYSYDDTGELVSEVYMKNGTTVKVTAYTRDDTQQNVQESVEELYRDGKPFLKIFYRGKERLREEFIDAR
ncbi:MAG TPA: hypothetical protein PLG43_03775 [Spirochaetia bacterium]|nr:hypothetical protein [Spirochaetia bacterium]